MRTHQALGLLAFGIVSILASSVSDACSIPVYRYALEFWEPDPYEFVVFHRGELAAEDEERLQRLEASAWPSQPNRTARNDNAETERSGPNYVVARVNLAGHVEEPVRALWEKQQDKRLPYVVIRYPLTNLTNQPLAAMPLEDLDADTWLHSPARETITKRLANGETAVCVVVQSGDAEKDAAAEKTLADSIKTLEQTLVLPEQTPEEGDLQTLGVEKERPLRIDFSILPLSKDDPKEKSFVDMLVNSEEDLVDYADSPMVFAVFGRGRMLPALVGQGITDRNLHKMGSFLVGPCSCQVKAENPGVDLLFTADWDALVPVEEESQEEGNELDLLLPPLPGPSVTSLTAGDDSQEDDKVEKDTGDLVTTAATSTDETAPAPAVLQNEPDSSSAVTTTSTTEVGEARVLEPAATGVDTESEITGALDSAGQPAIEDAIQDGGRARTPFFTGVLILVGIGLVVLAFGTFKLMAKAQ